MTVGDPPDYAAIFGSNLRAARVHVGLKQSELAERTGMTQQHLSLIEVGRHNVTLRTLASLAEACGCWLPDMLKAAPK